MIDPRRRPILLAAGMLLPLVLAAVVLVVLDARAAYHSPFRRTGSQPPTPLMQAYVDLAEAASERAEAEARRADLLASLDTEKMIGLGQEIVSGKGLCFNCHKVGSTGGGTQGPNLEGVGERAGSRVAGLSGAEYLAQSLYQPEAFIVPGFAPAMTPAHKSPMALSHDEILWVVAYLQSLGGVATVEPATVLPFKPEG